MQKLEQAVREFYEQTHPPKDFVPGVDYIPPASKVIDFDDIWALVSASAKCLITAAENSDAFEKKISQSFGRNTPGLLVNSGSSANLVAVSSLGSPLLENFKIKPAQPGDEFITVAAGFPTTVNPILQNGWVPVFVDVDFKTLNALPEKIMEARTPKTRGVILAHTLGNPYRVDELSKWCEKEGLFLVEDCCDALGSTLETSEGVRAVGSFGDFATVSFYPAHHMTTGEGGAVIPKDRRFRRAAESMRDWGRDCWCPPAKDNTCGKRFEWKMGGLPEGYDHKYTYSSIGYNLKMTDIQAALGLTQLQKVATFVEKRRKNWKSLYDGVKSSPLLRENLIPVEPTQGSDPSWFAFPMHCSPSLNRHKLTQFLETHKVGTRLLFGGNLTKQPAYKKANYRIHGELTATDEIMARTFWVGVHPALNEAKIRYMLETLEAGVRAQR